MEVASFLAQSQFVIGSAVSIHVDRGQAWRHRSRVRSAHASVCCCGAPRDNANSVALVSTHSQRSFVFVRHPALCPRFAAGRLETDADGRPRCFGRPVHVEGAHMVFYAHACRVVYVLHAFENKTQRRRRLEGSSRANTRAPKFVASLPATSARHDYASSPHSEAEP